MDAETFATEVIHLFDEYSEFFGLDDAAFPDSKPQRMQCDFEYAVNELICKLRGHEIGPDQCGKPEHDLCYRCGKRRVEIEK